MKKISFLVLFAFFFQTCLFAANAHLCLDDAVSHVCSDRCPDEKPKTEKQGSGEKDSKGSIHHDCGQAPAITTADAPVIVPAQRLVVKFSMLPDPGIQSCSDIFHPPA